MERGLYSGNENFLIRLMYEDTRKKSYSSFVYVLKTKYIGYDVPRTTENAYMERLRKRFKEIIRELDREGQIEKVFTYCKEPSKRPIWEVSAVDAKAFYKEIDKMGFLGALGYMEAARLYSKFCIEEEKEEEKGKGANCEKIEKLIECFPENRDCGDWYKEYKRLDRAAEILCQLVPMVSYKEDGSRYIKTYSQWKEDCEKIVGIVHEKTLALGMDQVELKAAELVRSYMHELSENAYEKSVQVCFKERYLEFLAEQSEKFFQSFDKVYGVLENVDNKKDMEDMAKRAVSLLDIK